MSPRVTRRGALAAGGLAAAAGAAVAAAGLTRGEREEPARTRVPAAPGLPGSQHAWNGVLRQDEHGNPQLPRHHRFILLDLASVPDADGAARLEDALRALERRHPYGPDGLLTLVAWGPAYFDAIGAPSPVPLATPMNADELPEIDDAPCCLLLASDDEPLLERVQRQLVGGGEAPDGEALDLRPLLRVREIRAGFAGAGLPAREQRAAGGFGVERPIGRDAPLFMGFKSGLRRNQATEDDVTIPAGPWAGGTTLHLSAITLELPSWYELSERDRVARMYAPQQSPADVARFTDDAPAPEESVARTAARHGRVGHTQALAAARRDGRPLILRRDVNTVDDGGPGVHFAALQRSVDDFVTTHRAMTAARSRAAPRLTGQLNNGINEWMRITRRGNYVVPPRASRAFPLVRGDRDA